VQAVLQSDKDLPALLGNGHNYERWIKHGSGADDVMTNSNDSDEPLLGDSLSHTIKRHMEAAD